MKLLAIFLFLFFRVHCLEICEKHQEAISLIKSESASSVDDAQSHGGGIYPSYYLFNVYDDALWEFRKCKSYSQFAFQFSDFMSRCKLPGQPYLIKGFQKVGDRFLELYTKCIQDHGNILAFYERGKIFYDRGFYFESVSDIRAILEKGFGDELLQNFNTEDALLLRGKALFEIAQYEEAIELLSKIINKNPQNKEAYYNRAIAYFETGNFDLALMDYVLSERSNSIVNAKLLTSGEFYSALIQGLTDGGLEGLKNFAPSLCSTAYGLGKSLWSFGVHPVNSSIEFANHCQEVCNNSINFLKTLDKSKVIDCAIEVQMLYNQFANLSDGEKGALFGYCVGKYGVDFFAGCAIASGISSFKKMQEANRVCSLESMLLSQNNKNNLTALAVHQSETRHQFFQNVKLHVDRQNKHVPSAHNYMSEKSIFTHPDPQGLINKFAGKGVPIGGRTICKPDYRERVNFGEFVGFHVNPKTKVQTPTTFAEIRYDSKGQAHIVPCLENK